MKKYQPIFFVCSFFMIILSACQNKQSDIKGVETEIRKDSLLKEMPFIKFENTTFDFGEIKRETSNSITTSFQFINEGEKPLIIQKADVSCGCVYVEYPQKPVLKGETASIEVTLDVNQLDGHFSKKIFIQSNAYNDVELLHVAGSVL